MVDDNSSTVKSQTWLLPEKLMKFQQIRSATSIVTFGGVRFLIDPMLAPMGAYPSLPYTCSTGRGNPDCELPCSLEELFKVDAVIVTHLHYDHFDEEARKRLPKNLPILSQSNEDARALRDWGFEDVRVLSDEGIEFQGVTLYRTPCEHGDSDPVTAAYYRATENGATACGVVLDSPLEPERLYLAGDTVYCDFVSETIKRFRPAVMAVNAAGAQFPLGHPLIMNQYDVEILMRDFPEIVVIATHVEGVSHATVTRSLLREFAREHKLDKLLIPGDGETLQLSKA